MRSCHAVQWMCLCICFAETVQLPVSEWNATPRFLAGHSGGDRAGDRAPVSCARTLTLSRQTRSGMRCESEISKIRLRDEVRAHFDVLRVKGGGGSTKSGLHRFGPWLLLNFVVMLWSSDECLIKHMLDTGKARSPAFLNASRFTVAALVFLPWGPAAPWKAGMRDLWASGAELGLWMFIGFATQAIGLQYTTVSRSAFLLYLNVVLVPVIGSVLFNHTIRWTTWASVALACLGTILLGYDGGKPNVGDAWCLAAAVSSALFILRLEAAAQKHSAAALNCASMLVVAALCLIWLVATAGFNSLKPTLQEAGTALYLGCVPTALCSFLQTVGQREIEAESAAIIYALDPVYTAILGALVMGDRFGGQGLLGGGCVLLASLLNLQAGGKGDL